MGIFNNPKRLAKLLASINVPGKDRPLTPVITARWLHEGVEELGSEQEVMERVELKKSMWSSFKRLLKINENIENSIVWGTSNPETLEIGFSAAHSIASFEPSEQTTLVNAMWDSNQSFGLELILRIKSFYKSHPEKTLNDAITSILKIDMPKKLILDIFISGLKDSIYDNLKKRSLEKNITIDEFGKEILSRSFSENSLIGVKIKKNLVRIAFSTSGKKEFDKMTNSNTEIKNNLINTLFEKEGF